MDSPVRKALKRNDYLRHKLFRKIKRRQRNKVKLDLKIAEKELKRRLRRPKFDGGTDDNKVKVTERTYPDGSVVYFADDGKTLTPINTLDSDDMSNWTWQDTDNPRVTYTGIGNTKDSGEIKQGEGPKSGLGKLHKKLYQVSNRHLLDPIFGAYARFADSWDNDTNPLKAIWELPATKAAVMELAWAKGLQAANRFKNVAVNYERLGKMAPKELEEFFMSRPDLVRESNRAKLFGAAYNKFADDVVKPKYASAIAATGREYTPEIDAVISNTPKVYEADFGPYSKWGGYYSTGGGRIMMNSRAAGTDSQLFGRHAHEVHHGYRDLLGLLLKFYPNLDIQTNGESIAQIARSGYTPGEMNALEAYQFTPLKLKLSPDLKPLWEKGATNAEIASRIYYDTGLTGKELNDAIMKMPKSKLMEYLKTNAYGQNFLKSPWTKDKEKAIREALTTVASVMPFGVAYNLKYDGGKKAGIDVTYRDVADAYDYLNAHPDASVVLDELRVVGHAPNASQRLAKYIQESAARDIDKVMLGYLAAGIAPVAMQAATPGVIAASDAIGGSAAGQVATKALTSPIGKSMAYGTAGATGADIAAKAVTGKTFEEWGEQDLGLPWYLSGFVNPGGYLMPASSIRNMLKRPFVRTTSSQAAEQTIPQVAVADYSTKSDNLTKYALNEYLSGERRLTTLIGAGKFANSGGMYSKYPGGTLSELVNTVIPRLKANRPWMNDMDVENLVLNNQLWGLYPDELFNEAGHPSAVGLHYSRNDGIAIRAGYAGSDRHVLPHEVRHRIDDALPATEYEDKVLSDAYDNDFIEVNSWVDGPYDPSPERVTTNSDARAVVLGPLHLRQTSPQLQNKIIDSVPDEQIFKSVEKANGYGEAFIKRLRRRGKLTHEKANQLRLSMKVVPAALPFAVATYGTELYSSGKDIHIKPSRRGTFTAAAKKHGMSVQAYARKVLKAPKGKYSSAMRKKANFARNAAKFKH